MTEDDLSDVARLHLASWQAAYRQILPDELLSRLTVHEFIETWKTIIRVAGRLNWVYGDTQGIRGYISCKQRFENGQNLGEIIGIYVLPEAWHQGIGKQLMAHALAWLQQQHCDLAYLWTMVDNHSARAFYEKIGFKRTNAIRTTTKYGYAIQEMEYIYKFDVI